MLGKSVLITGKGYVRIRLTEEETEKAMEELLRFNVKELVRVIKIVKGGSVTVDINQSDMIRLMFEKQGIASYTWLGVKLDEKIDKERKAAGKE